MNDHVTISVNHPTALSSSSSSSSSSGGDSEITKEHGAEINVEEISPLLNQRKEEEEEAEEICIQRDLVLDRSDLSENFGTGFSRYIKTVIPDVVFRRKADNAQKVVGISDMVARGSHKDLATTSTNVENGITKEIDVFGHEENDTLCCPSKETEICIKAPVVECRICQEEDDIANLESPCACSGSLKFAHRKCIQHWCNEKGDTMCEICQKPFQGGYVYSQPAEADSIPINVSADWDIATGQPRLFALAADHHFLDTDYDEYAGSHAHSAACFRSVALMVHVLSLQVNGEEVHAKTLSLVRAAGFLIPCYIMARAMNALQIRRQQQEATIAATEVRYLFQAGQVQGIVPPGTQG